MDAIHSFAHHKDTVHNPVSAGAKEFSVSEAHHHCAFLSFQLMPFAAPPHLPFYGRVPAKVFAVYSEAVAAKCACYFIPRAGLRGPPADC